MKKENQKSWKNKLKKSLGTGILIGAGALATFLPSKLNAQSADLMKSVPIYGKAPASVIPTVKLNGPTPLEVIGNPFSQPNIQEYLGRGKLDWYGSGDVNDDGKIDSLDLKAMDSMSNDRSDVDGDGMPSTANDKKILGDYLSGKIPYLPGHWNELTTRDERVSWLEKMIKVDTTNKIPTTPPYDNKWVCADRSIQEQINFYGISNVGEFIKNQKTNGGDNFSIKDLNKFNLPTYVVGTTTNDNVAHTVMGTLIGNDPLNFNDWYFWSVYDDSKVVPGDWSMNANSSVSIGLEAYVKDYLGGSNFFQNNTGIVEWNLNGGVATLTGNWKTLLLQNPNIITPHVGALEKLVVDSGKYPKGTALTPEFLQSQGYKAIPDTSKENTTLPVNLSYIDSDTTKLSDTSYQFLRKFFAWVYSGGVTKSDSTVQLIEADKITDVKDYGIEIPKEFKLYQNYPNPFNPSTNISYKLQGTSYTTLKVLDLLGREVATLVNEEKSPGNYEVKFDGSNLTSGVYIYRLQAGNFVEAKKMILIK